MRPPQTPLSEDEWSTVPSYLRSQLGADLPKLNELVDAIKRVDALPLKRHRAGDDARWLATLLTELGLMNAAESVPLFAWPSAQGRLRA